MRLLQRILSVALFPLVVWLGLTGVSLALPVLDWLLVGTLADSPIVVLGVQWVLMVATVILAWKCCRAVWPR